MIVCSSEEKETDTKKAKKDTLEGEETNKVAFSNKNKEDTVEPDLPWDDISCLYCDQTIPMQPA